MTVIKGAQKGFVSLREFLPLRLNWPSDFYCTFSLMTMNKNYLRAYPSPHPFDIVAAFSEVRKATDEGVLAGVICCLFSGINGD